MTEAVRVLKPGGELVVVDVRAPMHDERRLPERISDGERHLPEAR